MKLVAAQTRESTWRIIGAVQRRCTGHRMQEKTQAHMHLQIIYDDNDDYVCKRKIKHCDGTHLELKSVFTQSSNCLMDLGGL